MVNSRWYKDSSIYSTLIYSTMNADAGVTQLTNGKNANAGLLFPSVWAFTYEFSTSYRCIHQHQLWTCRVYPFQLHEFWNCKVYPFPQPTFHRHNYGLAGCIHFYHLQQNLRAGCINFYHQQSWRAGCIPSTTSIVWTCSLYLFLLPVQWTWGI
jgi:hypothetical protein